MENSDNATTENATEPITEPTIETQPVETQPTETVSLGQKNALSKAKSYLNISGFSYKRLIEQLEYEGFTDEQAEYGANAVGY